VKTYLSIALTAFLAVSCALRQAVPLPPMPPMPPKKYTSAKTVKGATLLMKSAAVSAVSTNTGPPLPSVGALGVHRVHRTFFIWADNFPQPYSVYTTTNLLTPKALWPVVGTITPEDYVTFVATTNQPIGFFCGAATNYTINLEWGTSASASVAGYTVWIGLASGQETNGTVVGMATNVAINNLHSGINYYFVVTARDATGGSSAPSPELKFTPPYPQLKIRTAPPYYLVYTPTNMVVACSVTNVPFTLYSTTNLLVPMVQWSPVLITNSISLGWDTIPPVQFFYGLDANSNRMPLALWTTGITTTNYNP
jgi:hypothetical protein